MLRLICSIDQSEAGQAKILCEYRAEINRASGRAVKDLWHDVATFLIGGSQEGVEVARLISGMRRQLRPSVDEVIRLAKEP